MVKIFISYSRVDTDFLKDIYPLLGRMYQFENIWYDDWLHGGDNWWETILEKIAWCDVFIYLLSNESVTSEYCQAEFQEAQRLSKFIITIQVRDRTKLDSDLSGIQYIDMKPGVDEADAVARLFAAIGRVDVNAIRKKRARWKGQTPKPGTVTDAKTVARPDMDTPPLTATLPAVFTQPEKRNALSEPIAIIIAAVITGIFAIIAALIAIRGDNTPINESTGLITQVQVTETPSATYTPSDTPTATLSATEIEASIQAEMQAIQTEERQTQISNETATQESIQVLAQSTADSLTSTAESWTNTPTPDIRATAEARSTEDAQATLDAQSTQQAIESTTERQQRLNAQETEFAIATSNAQTATQQAAIESETAQANQFSTTTARSTATQLARDLTAIQATENVRRTQAIIFVTETASARLTETQVADSTAIRVTVNAIATDNAQQAIPIIARNPIETNSDWLPNRQTFNGVAMMLVPAGCFDMGSSDGEGDERPIHEICFDEPFWIDRYEVSNEQFERFGGRAANHSEWTEAVSPRQNVTWFEARAFCALRAVRLPTEAEWEYAARGLDNLRYPWGNVYNSSRVNDASNSGGDVFFNVAPVTTLESGASWVGAYNMLGNVWEWVSSMYMTYPYGADHESDVVEVRPRVARGGSYLLTFGIRNSDRNSLDPNSAYPYLGFRCARDFEG